MFSFIQAAESSLFRPEVFVVSVAPLSGLSVNYTQSHVVLMGIGADFTALIHAYKVEQR